MADLIHNDPTQPLPGFTPQPTEAIAVSDARRRKTGEYIAGVTQYATVTYELNRPFRFDIDWSKHAHGEASHAYSATPPQPRPTSRERDGTNVTANNLSAYV